jgi:ABC-type dipeptide/oligopeptide/nickel transport system permease subunit
MGNIVKLADAVRTAKSIKVSHARKFAQHVVPEVVRPARIIWNQAIGAIFLLFALLFFGNATRYLSGLGSDSRNGVALAFSLFLGILMAIFGVSSFLKARRISRP